MDGAKEKEKKKKKKKEDKPICDANVRSMDT